MKLISILFFGLINFSSANECKSVNLYEIQNNPINTFPIIDQLKIGNCYSIAASNLVEYYLKSKNQNTVLDPIWNAYVYKNQNKFQKISIGIGSGYLPAILETMRTFGTCSNDELQIKYNELKNTNQISNEEIVQYYQKLWKSYQFNYVIRPHQTNNEIYDKVVRNLNENSHYKKILTKEMSDQFRIITSINNKLPNQIFYKDIMKGCTNKIELNFPLEESVWIQDQSDIELRTKFEDVLVSQNPRPVAISYCNSIWNQPKGIQILKRPYRFYSQIISFLNCDSHYSVVVGMQPMDGDCHYLIRNSYGEKYSSPYRKCFVEYEDKSRESVEISKVKNQSYKVLGCWFGEKDLFNNLATITWLKED